MVAKLNIHELQELDFYESEMEKLKKLKFYFNKKLPGLKLLRQAVKPLKVQNMEYQEKIDAWKKKGEEAQTDFRLYKQTINTLTEELEEKTRKIQELNEKNRELQTRKQSENHELFSYVDDENALRMKVTDMETEIMFMMKENKMMEKQLQEEIRIQAWEISNFKLIRRAPMVERARKVQELEQLSEQIKSDLQRCAKLVYDPLRLKWEIDVLHQRYVQEIVKKETRSQEEEQYQEKIETLCRRLIMEKDKHSVRKLRLMKENRELLATHNQLKKELLMARSEVKTQNQDNLTQILTHRVVVPSGIRMPKPEKNMKMQQKSELQCLKITMEKREVRRSSV